MSKIKWASRGDVSFEDALDRGILYITDVETAFDPTTTTVGLRFFTQTDQETKYDIWIGLQSIDESVETEGQEEIFFEGIKVYDHPGMDEVEYELTAYTYPRILNTHRRCLNFLYRTKEIDDLGNESYQLHILYNPTFAPSDTVRNTLNKTPDATNFVWQIRTVPQSAPGFAPSAHVIIEYNEMHPELLALLEKSFYGTDEYVPYPGNNEPQIPSLEKLIKMVDEWNLIMFVENADGSFTVTCPDELVTRSPASQFDFQNQVWEIRDTNAVLTDRTDPSKPGSTAIVGQEFVVSNSTPGEED